MLLTVNAILGIITLVFPEGERWIGKNFKLQFVSAEQLFNPSENRLVDLDTVLGDMVLEDTSNFDKDIYVEADSAIKTPELNKRIQYPSEKSMAMETFFRALLNLEKGEESMYRILHYGDSQLEGDRISDYLRNKLQLRFGGSGPGIVLPIDVSRSRISVFQSESKDWKKFAIYGNVRHPEGIYGIGGASYVYTGTVPVKIGVDTFLHVVYDSMVPLQVLKKGHKDTSVAETSVADTSLYRTVMVPFDSGRYRIDTVFKNRYEMRTSESSWLKFKCAAQSYPKVRTFERVELMYSAKDTCYLQLMVDGKEFRKILLPTTGASRVSLFNGEVNQEVTIRFKGISPVLFGVLLDGRSGVAVDNFPMRGSSGTGFEVMNQRLFTEQLKKSGTKLIIMQYGINVVPNPISNYDYYERLFYNQLKAIKKAYPEVSILVIGPSDMSRKVAGEYVSYPNITKIRDAMRNAAFKTDCAFWDLYAAMGGQNSMVSWVQNEPPLAAKDFTHFNTRGARFVAEMLYDAIMSKYLEWKKEPEALP